MSKGQSSKRIVCPWENVSKYHLYFVNTRTHTYTQTNDFPSIFKANAFWHKDYGFLYLKVEATFKEQTLLHPSGDKFLLRYMGTS